MGAIITANSLHTHSQQIIDALARQKTPLSLRQLIEQLNLTEGEVSRAVLFLKKNDPSLINELGTSMRYQLSRAGMKLKHIEPISPASNCSS
ncbi:MAG: hypothetical protein AABZ55_02410, partial [Bdellovibrionota bacterium]